MLHLKSTLLAIHKKQKHIILSILFNMSEYNRAIENLLKERKSQGFSLELLLKHRKIQFVSINEKKIELIQNHFENS